MSSSPSPEKPIDPTPGPELTQVLRGLALNRTPGWNFPCNFLEISFDDIGPDRDTLSVEPGPHCVDANGEAHLGVVGIVADICMAQSMRQTVGRVAQLATVAMAVHFSGAPALGRIVAHGHFDGFTEGTAGHKGLARAELYADGRLYCTSSGTFMSMDSREGRLPLPMPRRGREVASEPLPPQELDPQEMALYGRACDALAAGGPASFIDHFWGLQPSAIEGGAVCEFANGMHVGNRFGHTQGGLTWALAATTARIAVGDAWILGGASAWYLAPGTGPTLRAESQILQQGRFVAVVRTRVTDVEGRAVLEAITQHSRRG